MSLGRIGQHVMDFVTTFPAEMRGLLRAILQSNWQLYQLLRASQHRLGPSPTGLLDSNIVFEDALGQVQELPYQTCRHWEVCNMKSDMHKPSLTRAFIFSFLNHFSGFISKEK